MLYKSNNPSEDVVYSEFITAKGFLFPLSCYKFTVNHGFLLYVVFQPFCSVSETGRTSAVSSELRAKPALSALMCV